MSHAPRKRRMEKNKENNAFYAIKGTGSDPLSLPILAAIVEEEETTRALNPLFNSTGSMNRTEEETKKRRKRQRNGKKSKEERFYFWSKSERGDQ